MKSLLGFMIVFLTLAVSGQAIGSEEGHGGIKLGILSCQQVPGGYNMVIHSSNPVECEFSSGNAREYYVGEAGVALGLNLEWNPAESIVFAVFGGASDIRPGQFALAGKYYGAKASASVGVGTGVQILMGGGHKSFSLQPFALEGSTGLGASAGLGYLYLDPKR
ncbi:MAG: DUF992 domain-containing protein [Nitrospirae bacterium]|nr:DUF992 domain-containing protein [Magnetococcales bacterium]HAT49219.1 hypothetical protein [Alphaproteobacteria bacterium]